MLKPDKIKDLLCSALLSHPTHICHATHHPLHSRVGVGKHSQRMTTIIFKGCIHYKKKNNNNKTKKKKKSRRCNLALGSCLVGADDADEAERQSDHSGGQCHTE